MIVPKPMRALLAMTLLATTASVTPALAAEGFRPLLGITATGGGETSRGHSSGDTRADAASTREADGPARASEARSAAGHRQAFARNGTAPRDAAAA